MSKNGYKVIDSDMHIMEPADLWQKYGEGKYKDLGPIGITSANLQFIAVIFTIRDTITHLICGYALIVCTQKRM